MQRPVPRQKISQRFRHIQRRQGFTLVELLVVVAIIAVLLSLIGVATMSMLGSAKVASTKATIFRIQGLIQQRVDAVTRKDPDPVLVDQLTPTFGKKAAESIARKITFRQAFPQTWAEVPTNVLTSLPPGSPAIPSPAPATTAARQARESAEVLHMILTKASVLGYPTIGEGEFSNAEVQDTDGNGWPEFIDAWGQPLRFYRWPTRLVRGGAWSAAAFTPSATAKYLIPALPTTAAELTHDADDRYGFLKVRVPMDASRSAGVILPAQVNNYEQGTGMMGTTWGGRGAFCTPETYSVPLLISGGPDLVTGLFEPSDSSVNFGYWGAVNPAMISNTFDDISNHNIRSGGK